jgi:hypothetical protein
VGQTHERDDGSQDYDRLETDRAEHPFDDFGFNVGHCGFDVCDCDFGIRDIGLRRQIGESGVEPGKPILMVGQSFRRLAGAPLRRARFFQRVVKAP